MRCRNLQHSGCLVEYCDENGTTKPQGFRQELRSFLMYGIQCDRKKMSGNKMKQSDDDKDTVSALVQRGSKPVLFPLR
jgi:hypothetical protein